MPARRCVYLMDPVNLATQHRALLCYRFKMLPVPACHPLRLSNWKWPFLRAQALLYLAVRAYCHFYYFSTLKFFNRTLGRAFHRCAHRRVLGEQRRREHFFLLTWSFGGFRSLFSCLLFMISYLDVIMITRAIPSMRLFTTWFFKCEPPCALAHFLKGDLTWYIRVAVDYLHGRLLELKIHRLFLWLNQ